MTDLELVAHAKEYIDQLANGIDPISGTEMSDDAVLNQPRLIRCFFYVSDILRQVVENGGQVGAKKKVTLSPFFLTMEERKSIPFSSEALSISKFVALLNDARQHPEQMKKLSYSTVTAWLMRKGFLTEGDNLMGGRTKVPTEQGRFIGLSQEQRHSVMQHRDYLVTLYNESAQRFIVDNLDDILEVGNQSGADAT